MKSSSRVQTWEQIIPMFGENSESNFTQIKQTRKKQLQTLLGLLELEMDVIKLLLI